MSIVNKNQLAEIIGVSERTLTEWQEQGMPIELVGGRGLENQYDTVKVIEWRIQKALAGQKNESGRERLERLQADELEMKIEERAGRLVSAIDIEQIWTEAVVATRTEMLSLADRLKGRLDATYRINVDPVVIENEVLASLNKLAINTSRIGVDEKTDEAPAPDLTGADS